MKKYIALALALIMLFSLCACSAKQAETAAKPAEASQTTETAPEAATESGVKDLIVGYCEFSIGGSWSVQAQNEFMTRADELKEEGVIAEYYMTDAGGDTAKQVSDMQDLLTKGCNIIIVCPGSTEALNATIEEATEDGVAVITFDSQVSTDKVTAAVTSDQALFGKRIGTWLGEQLPDGGKVVVLDGEAGASTSIIRSENAIAAMLEVSPNIEIVAQVNANWDYATAKAAMEDILIANPVIDGVLSQGGAMTQAAMDAFAEAGRKMVPMTGEDNNGFMKTWKKYQAEGFSSVAPGIPTYETAVALDSAIAYLNGETLDPVIYVEADPITDADLDDYIREDLADGYWVHSHLSEEKLVSLFGEGGSAADLG